jgi:hypothetical protein
VILVGGPNPSGEVASVADDGKEPAFHHAGPYELDAEVSHSWNACAHVDFTVGPGHRALFACKKKIPYLGFCLSDVHCTEVMKYIETRVFTCMQTEGDELYQPALAALVVQAAPEASEDEGEDDVDDEEPEEEEEGDLHDEPPQKKAKSKAKAKGKGKAKGKAAPKTAARAALLDKLKSLQKGTAAAGKDESEPDSE